MYYKQEEFPTITEINLRKIFDEASGSSHHAGDQQTEEAVNQEEHSEREIFLVYSGKTSFLCNGKIFELKDKEAFFINSWVPHQQDYSSCYTSGVHLWFHLHVAKLLVSIVKIGENGRCYAWHLVFPPDLLSVIERRWNLAEKSQDFSEKNKFYSGIIRILLEEFALQNRKIITHPAGEYLVQSIEFYLGANYGRRVQIDELAKFAGTNRSQLMRLFKKYRHMTIGEYIDQQRMAFIEKAQNRGLNQKEIGWQLGFSSASAFYLWKKRKKINIKKRK